VFLSDHACLPACLPSHISNANQPTVLIVSLSVCLSHGMVRIGCAQKGYMTVHMMNAQIGPSITAGGEGDHTDIRLQRGPDSIERAVQRPVHPVLWAGWALVRFLLFDSVAAQRNDSLSHSHEMRTTLTTNTWMSSRPGVTCETAVPRHHNSTSHITPHALLRYYHSSTSTDTHTTSCLAYTNTPVW